MAVPPVRYDWSAVTKAKSALGWMRSLGSLWLWLSNFMPEERLGTLWQETRAKTALDEKVVKSEEGGLNVRLSVRNHLDTPVVFCWVDNSSKPHHFRIIPPTETDEDALVTEHDFIERTRTGHAFLMATGSKEECQQANKQESLGNLEIVACYQPESSDCAIHLLCIGSDDQEIPPSLWCCLRGTKRKRPDFLVSVKRGSWDPTPLDTTCKKYKSTTIAGWPVYLEKNWHGGDKELEAKFEKDLKYATSCLPPHAQDILKKKTPIWINKSLEYGPKACPIKGSALCFHPGKDWLVENGCHAEKCHSVELYCSKNYKETSIHWETGGVLIHELSHAYHCLCLPDGYENKEIKECWAAAMKDKLYENVKVHGPQGPTAKAYACTDQMEYWAELSTAFLGGKDADVEYNKWFPFNHAQLKEHDPRAYELLTRLWKTKSPGSQA